MGITVPPTAEHLSDVSKSLRRHRRDGDDVICVDPRSATSTTHPTHRLFDDAARNIGLYRVRSQPLPVVTCERDNVIEPLATRYGLGFVDGTSKSCDYSGAALA